MTSPRSFEFCAALTSRGGTATCDAVFTLAEIRSKSTEIHILKQDGSGESCLAFRVDPDSYLVRYALFRWVGGTHPPSGEEGEEFELVFEGHGYSGTREMRHIYFGETGSDGYLFYAPMRAIAACVPLLAKFFEVD